MAENEALRQRQKRGAIDFDSAELAIQFDEHGKKIGKENVERVMDIAQGAAGPGLQVELGGQPIEEVRQEEGDTSFGIGLLANAVLPGRLGEFARPFLIAQRSSIRRSTLRIPGSRCASAQASIQIRQIAATEATATDASASAIEASISRIGWNTRRNCGTE